MQPALPAIEADPFSGVIPKLLTDVEHRNFLGWVDSHKQEHTFRSPDILVELGNGFTRKPEPSELIEAWNKYVVNIWATWINA